MSKRIESAVTVGVAGALAAIFGFVFLSMCSAFVNDIRQSEMYLDPPQRAERKGVERRILSEDAQRNGKPDKYAVLINGTNELRFKIDMSLVYQVLLERGFQRKNIYILDHDGSEEFLYPADGRATKSSVEAVFSHLGRKVDEDDDIIVHISAHGQRTKIKSQNPHAEEYQEISEMVLPSGTMTEVDVERYLSEINPRLGIVTTDACYGGGLAKRVGKGKYVGIAGTTEDASAYCGVRDSFGGFFYQAFRRPEESDSNGDGRVTLDEAFGYAKERHSYSKGGKVNPRMATDFDVKNLSFR